MNSHVQSTQIEIYVRVCVVPTLNSNASLSMCPRHYRPVLAVPEHLTYTIDKAMITTVQPWWV